MDPVSEILDKTDLRISFLRQFTKEDLIHAVMEMKNASLVKEMRIKELEYEVKLAGMELKVEKMRAGLSERGEIPQIPFPTAATRASAPFEDRVSLAREQGMRWNHSDKRPSRASTVRRKVEEWEKGVEKGRKAALSEYVGWEYDQLVQEEGEAFVLGLCEGREKELGIDPLSKYLKVRYGKLMNKEMGKNTTRQSPTVPTPPSPSLSIARDIVRKLLGPTENEDKRVRILRPYVERNLADLTAMGAEALRMIVCSKHTPIVFEYDRDREECSNVEKYQSVKVKKLYDDRLEEFLSSYVRERKG